MKERKLCILSLFLLLPLLLCSCVTGSFVTRKSVQNNTCSQMSMRYEYFDGYKQRIIKIKDGETKTMAIEITSESGRLDLYVAKNNEIDNAVFFRENISAGSYTATLAEAGKYTIRVTAVKHKGSYKITWDSN
ncbi:MAG: PPC domain-containing protein [Clostridia bacterium]|nr:PPC domain-containing protein [Clostridia bacterium]